MTARHGKNIPLSAVLKTMLSPGVPTLGVEEALRVAGTVVFLDCREKEEFNVSHLPGACWIGFKDFTLTRLDHLRKNMPIVIYCSIGKRSDIIAKRLLLAGYTDVKNLAGGIFEWSNKGATLYKNGEPTNDVHAYNRFWARWLKKGNKVFSP
jgi:rhodanese-related sulfurtransferase